MEIKEFLKELNVHRWSIATFNTYCQNDKQYYFIIVTQSGNIGQFIKREGVVSDINTGFVEIINMINVSLMFG